MNKFEKLMTKVFEFRFSLIFSEGRKGVPFSIAHFRTGEN